MDGVGLIPVVMGLFGISEVLSNLEKQEFSLFVGKIKNLFPNLEDWKASKWPMIRGTVIGFFLRHPARRKCDHLVDHFLRSREEGLKAS